jgi:hypothetical protein
MVKATMVRNFCANNREVLTETLLVAQNGER